MKYNKTIRLKDGRNCILRNGTEQDGKTMLDIFVLTHEQTDYLLTYPEENSMTAEQEAQFLKDKITQKPLNCTRAWVLWSMAEIRGAFVHA